MKKPVNGTKNLGKSQQPALSPEAREEQLIALATDLVEQRLRDGTATSQETTHFLRRAAIKEKERVELEILEKQKELITAKTEALQSTKRMEEVYTDALAAMRRYSGQSEDPYD